MSEYDPTRMEENRALIAAHREGIANDRTEVLAEHGKAENLSRTTDGREWHSVGAWLMPGERIIVQMNNSLDGYYAVVEENKKLKEELAALREKLEKCEKDAERYRYWRDNHGWTGYFDDGATNSETADEIDAAIDAAIKGEKT